MKSLFLEDTEPLTSVVDAETKTEIENPVPQILGYCGHTIWSMVRWRWCFPFLNSSDRRLFFFCFWFHLWISWRAAEVSLSKTPHPVHLARPPYDLHVRDCALGVKMLYKYRLFTVNHHTQTVAYYIFRRPHPRQHNCMLSASLVPEQWLFLKSVFMSMSMSEIFFWADRGCDLLVRLPLSLILSSVL